MFILISIIPTGNFSLTKIKSKVLKRTFAGAIGQDRVCWRLAAVALNLSVRGLPHGLLALGLTDYVGERAIGRSSVF